MMKEELGLIENKKKPLEAAITTFVAFNLIGLIPLFPFVVMHALGIITASTEAFGYSVAFTAVAFITIGAVKGRILQKPFVKSGLGILAVGGIAAVVAFMVGYLLNLLVR